MESKDLLRSSIQGLLSELVDGASGDAGFVLNPGDVGLLRSLERLSDREASAKPGGRASVAAHVRHLLYGFGLMNRWARGENPFADADYAASWKQRDVDDDEWRVLMNAFEREVREWMTQVKQVDREWDATTVSGVIASAVHLAYHIGAIRQLAVAASGPSADE